VLSGTGMGDPTGKACLTYEQWTAGAKTEVNSVIRFGGVGRAGCETHRPVTPASRRHPVERRRR